MSLIKSITLVELEILNLKRSLDFFITPEFQRFEEQLEVLNFKYMELKSNIDLINSKISELEREIIKPK